MLSRKKIMPFLIIGLGILISIGLNFCSVSVDRGEREIPPVSLNATITSPESHLMYVNSQGNVTPLIQTRLIAEVSGIVNDLSSDLIPGGVVDAQQLLISIDSGDYVDALNRAEAEYEFSRAEEERARNLALDDLTSQSDLDQKIRMLRLAEANLERARRDLERTNIYSPFNGTVVSEEVDLGQFVNRGSNLAVIYSNNQLQIRLPVPSEQLGYIFDSSFSENQTRDVRVFGNYAGRNLEWAATVNSEEAEVDARSQMTYLIARIHENESNGLYAFPPVGIFLNAEIEGLTINNLYAINRSALRADGNIALIDSSNLLRFSQIEIYRFDGDRIFFVSDLVEDLRVVTSPTNLLVEGIQIIPVIE